MNIGNPKQEKGRDTQADDGRAEASQGICCEIQSNMVSFNCPASKGSFRNENSKKWVMVRDGL